MAEESNPCASGNVLQVHVPDQSPVGKVGVTNAGSGHPGC